MNRKLLMTIQGNYVAPRFDLATEVLIADVCDGKLAGEPKTIIMARPSDERLCRMILEEKITDVVCGGIDEMHYNFLNWKQIVVVDGVIADWRSALNMHQAGMLRQGQILLAGARQGGAA